MRQVIRRFLKYLEAEKNASETTIESYYPKSCAKRHMETVPRLRPRHGETLLAGPNESYLIGRVRSEALKPAFSVIIKTLHPLLAQDLGLSLKSLQSKMRIETISRIKSKRATHPANF